MEGVVEKSDAWETDAAERLRRRAVDESILEVGTPEIDKQTLEHWEAERVRSTEEELDHARAVAGSEAEILTDGGEDNAHGQAVLNSQLAMGDEDEGGLPVLDVGDQVTVADREPTVVVMERLEETADEHYIERIDETVAEYNGCHPDEDVYKVAFPGRDDDRLRDLTDYPYPRSMLELESRLHDRDEDEGGEK